MRARLGSSCIHRFKNQYFAVAQPAEPKLYSSVQELFQATVSALRALFQDTARAHQASRKPAFVALLEGVGRMIALRVHNHMSTLDKLERQKVWLVLSS